MTEVTVRRPTTEDYADAVQTFVDVMAQAVSDEDVTEAATDVELDRAWVADDGGRVVGTTAAHGWELSVPGGARVSFAGVSLVAVAPTHHRRGLGTRLMQHYADDCREHGDVLGGLFSSDAGIYARFGFGAATRMASVRVERDRAGVPDVTTTGRIEWHRLDAVSELLPEVFGETLILRPGEIVRTPAYWRSAMGRWTGAAAPRPAFAAVHYDETGRADGYVVYRVDPAWVDHTACNTAAVMELVGPEPVRLMLWRFLLQLEGVRTVVDRNARVDEPLTDVLGDGRQLKVTGVYDQLWLRVFDVPAAMSARTYAVDGRVRFGVAGPDGVTAYELVVAEGRAECTTVDAEIDVVLTPRALAGTYLGDRSVRALAAAGLVEVTDARAAALLDAMTSVEPKPQCLSLF